MKLFDKLLDKSSVLLKLSTLVGKLADELYKLGTTVNNLSKLSQEHHVMINDLYDRQDIIIKALRKESVELKSDIQLTNKTKESKPN